MIAYHVTTLAKLARYEASRRILPPVRAWRSPDAAARFSVQTGRRVIVRLRLCDARPLDGHRGEAVETRETVRWPEAAQ